MMKKILFFLLLVNCSTIASLAQKSDTAKAGQQKNNDGWQPTNWLNLTPAQQTKREAINKDAASKIKAIKEDAALTKEQKKRQITDVKKIQRNSFEGMLTDGQKAKLDTSFHPTGKGK